MKTPSPDLFRLINAMSASEKRYFKKDTKDSSTSELFDLINDQSAYEEDEIKKKLSDKSFAKNLKVHKNRLQQILLKNLRSYYEEKSAQSKIKVLIENGEILIKKQLYDLAFNQFEKALNICKNYEEYELMLVVLGVQARMSSYFKDMLPADAMPMVEMEKCAAIIQNYVQHAIVNKKILHFLNMESVSMQVSEAFHYIQKLIKEEIIDKEREPLSPIAERMYLHSQALMYNANNDAERSYELTKKILEKFESNPHIVEEKNAQYFNCIVNHLSFTARLDKLQEVENWVNKVRKHAENHEQLLPNLVYIYQTFVEALRGRQQFTKIKAILEIDFRALVEKFNLEDEYVSKLTNAFGVEAYIALDEYDKAGDIIVRILNSNQDLPKDMLYAIYILELIYHFDQKNFMLIENMVAAHQKRIRRNNEQLPFFEAVISFFKNSSNGANFERKNYFGLHQTSLAKFENDPVFFFLNLLFDYPLWVTSHERKISYAAILKQKEALKKR